MKIGCVILNYNDYENTTLQLERIREFSCLEKIIVVDNCSTDGSGEKLKALESGKIDVLLLKSNRGYGAGNNAGIRYGCEILGLTHIIIANPDTCFYEACIRRLAGIFYHHPEAGVAAAKMKDSSGGRQASGWRLLSFTEELMNTGPVCRRLFKKRLNYPADYGKGKRAVYVEAVHGSMLMVDGKKMMECGGYDERVFLYGEENILACRMKAKGFRTVQALDVSYIHENSATISKTYETALRRQRLRHESSLFYYKEYLHINPVQELAAKLFFKIVMAEIWFCSKVLRMKW
ncbi:glycosyltransferase family 2 protein [Lachnospiraceae bacterium 62-35]